MFEIAAFIIFALLFEVLMNAIVGLVLYGQSLKKAWSKQ